MLANVSVYHTWSHEVFGLGNDKGFLDVASSLEHCYKLVIWYLVANGLGA